MSSKNGETKNWVYLERCLEKRALRGVMSRLFLNIEIYHPTQTEINKTQQIEADKFEVTWKPKPNWLAGQSLHNCESEQKSANITSYLPKINRREGAQSIVLSIAAISSGGHERCGMKLLRKLCIGFLPTVWFVLYWECFLLLEKYADVTWVLSSIFGCRWKCAVFIR